MSSELSQGQTLSAISSPDSGDGQFMLIAGQHGVDSIWVSQLAGPMGWYDVAVVHWNDDRPDQIHPLHMMDFIQVHVLRLERPQKHAGFHGWTRA